MTHSFDLFRFNSNNKPIWICTANDMESARRLILQHAGEAKARFMVFSQKTQGKAVYEATKDELILVEENLKD